MNQPIETRAPSLELIFEAIHGFQRSAAVKAALDLDVFTGIAEGAVTAAQLAGRSSGSPKGMRILCDYLAVIGLLTKSADRYELTPDTNVFLDRKSPAYMGGAVGFLLSPTQMDAFRDLAATVRTGGAMAEEGLVAPDHPAWVNFARAMAPMMAQAVDWVSEPRGPRFPERRSG